MQKKQKFEEKLSFALEQIYAAASGERCWSLALEGVRRVLEAKTVNLSVFGSGDVDGESFAAGRADFFVSHFMGGAGAPFSTAELLLPENPGWRMRRRHDPATGYAELCIQRGDAPPV